MPNGLFMHILMTMTAFSAGDCKEGYGRARAFLCRKCMPRVAIVLLYTAAALAMIGLIKLLMYFESPDTATRPSLQQPIPSELLKVLVLHGQWLFILANLVGIPWPATLMYPLQVRSCVGRVISYPDNIRVAVGRKFPSVPWLPAPMWKGGLLLEALMLTGTGHGM
jgi:hypothetical protein